MKSASFWEQKVLEGLLNLLFQRMSSKEQVYRKQKVSTKHRTWPKDHALEVEEAFKLSRNLDSSQ